MDRSGSADPLALRGWPEVRAVLTWLDLCSGLGGASQPALDRGWRVIRVDIDPRFKPTIVADVRALPLRSFHVDVLWASPPCQDIAKWGMRCFFPDPPEPDLSIFSSVIETLRDFQPDYWFLENVQVAKTWIPGLLRASWVCGSFQSIRIPGHLIFGRFPGLLPQTKPHKGRNDDRRKRHDFGTGAYSRWGREAELAAEAAKIPYEIGDAICRSVESRAEEARASREPRP